MDWHKLQHTLFALDPTDPSEDLAKLRDAAQASAKMSKPSIDYLAESVNVPQGSLTMDRDYSVADFAALAGIRLDERQKHGDYTRGSDPMPKAKPGRTKHPLKDKLVGEEEIEEGPLDTIKKGAAAVGKAAQAGKAAFDAGKANYNTPGAITKGAQAMGGKPAPAQQKPQAAQVKSSVTGAQLGKQLGVSDPNMFNQAVMKVKQGQPLNRMHQAAMSDAFVKLMAMSPEQTQRAMQLLKRSEARTESQDKPKSYKKSTTNESIKDMLYAKLAAKK